MRGAPDHRCPCFHATHDVPLACYCVKLRIEIRIVSWPLYRDTNRIVRHPYRYTPIHQRALSWEDLKIPISKTRFKITFLESHSDLPGAIELMSLLMIQIQWVMHDMTKLSCHIVHLAQIKLVTRKFSYFIFLLKCVKYLIIVRHVLQKHYNLIVYSYVRLSV